MTDDEEVTPQEFFEIWEEAVRECRYHKMGEFGTYDGQPFLIVDDWESINSITAILNGYKGELDFPYVFGDFDKEFEKAKENLKQLSDAGIADGRLYRAEREVEQFENLKKYYEWLRDNDIAERHLDDFGIEIGFNDEFQLCGSCYKNVVRTSPDCWGWTPPLCTEEGYICNTCAPEFKDSVLEEYSNEAKSLPDIFDPEELGLVKINDRSFEHGLYGGQMDDPNAIIKVLNKQEIDVWFRVYPGQFDAHFDAYVRAGDIERARDIVYSSNIKTAEDPAEVARRGLEHAARNGRKCDDDHIQYTKTVETSERTNSKEVSNYERTYSLFSGAGVFPCGCLHGRQQSDR